MTLPRAILFDLDDTIISAGSRTQVFQTLVEEFALPPAAAGALEETSRWFWSDEARHKTSRFQLAEARAEVVRMVFEELDLPRDVAAPFAERFHAAREEHVCFPGAIETIDELKRRGVKLALVTNGDAPTQRAKVERFELAHRFDHVQIEGEAGFGKPQERAYLHAMQALGVAAHETWMVGDNLEWEVAAPQRLGIFAIWHDPLGAGLPSDSPVRPDRIVRSIAELLDDRD